VRVRRLPLPGPGRLIALSPATRAVVAAAIRAAAGREICGLVLARAPGEQRFLQLASTAEMRTGFSVTARELARGRRLALRDGWRAVAFLHSHATALDASAADLRNAARSELPWVVVRRVGDDLEISELQRPPG
jgi:proteasome lid subunit RPN8/RPN11